MTDLLPVFMFLVFTVLILAGYPIAFTIGGTGLRNDLASQTGNPELEPLVILNRINLFPEPPTHLAPVDPAGRGTRLNGA